MCVSGLPKRNGIKHAGEIATMALELLSAITEMKVPHLPLVSYMNGVICLYSIECVSTLHLFYVYINVCYMCIHCVCTVRIHMCALHINTMHINRCV